MNEVIISENNRDCMCKQSSGELYGTGCVQRHVPSTHFSCQAFGYYIRGGVSSTLKERDYKQSSTSLIVEEGTPLKVRRLTPLECARLQGLPDYWLDGVEGSDSAKYKMIGNGIAIPCAVDVLGRIVDELEDRNEDN